MNTQECTPLVGGFRNAEHTLTYSYRPIILASLLTCRLQRSTAKFQNRQGHMEANQRQQWEQKPELQNQAAWVWILALPLQAM